MKSRYDLFKASGTEEIYSIWLRQRTEEWAASGRRGEEMQQEKRDGWQFPILRSTQDHEEFDAWLNALIDPEKGGKI